MHTTKCVRKVERRIDDETFTEECGADLEYSVDRECEGDAGVIGGLNYYYTIEVDHCALGHELTDEEIDIVWTRLGDVDPYYGYGRDYDGC